MTEQALEAKKITKTREASWKKIIDEANTSLKKIEDIADVSRKEIIVSCCEQLEREGMPLTMICARVTRDLVSGGYVSKKTVLKWMDDKYKDPAKHREYEKKKNVPEQSSVEVPPKVEKKVTEDIIMMEGPKVEQYKIEDLEKYDKPFLIDIIKYLDSRVKAFEIITSVRERK